MEQNQQYRRNISAPNLLNICVDCNLNGEVKGRVYHCYKLQPVEFSNVIELVREAEQFFDDIAFPQASTKTRSLVEKNDKTIMQVRRPEKVVASEAVAQNRGELASFLTNVRFRQNSTWQGEALWLEQEKTIRFSNILDLIKEIDLALESVKKSYS